MSGPLTPSVWAGPTNSSSRDQRFAWHPSPAIARSTAGARTALSEPAALLTSGTSGRAGDSWTLYIGGVGKLGVHAVSGQPGKQLRNPPGVLNVTRPVTGWEFRTAAAQKSNQMPKKGNKSTGWSDLCEQPPKFLLQFRA